MIRVILNIQMSRDLKFDKPYKVQYSCEQLGDDKLSLDQYSGLPHENFIFFRKEFENIASLCNWPETRGVLQLKRALGGQALQELFANNDITTYQEGLEYLQLHYKSADAYGACYRKFRQVQQQAQQGAQKYYFYFTSLVQQCNVLATNDEEKISEKDQVNAFNDGLRPDIKSLAMLTETETLSKAYQFAQRAETGLFTTAKYHRMAKSNNFQQKNSKKRQYSETKTDVSQDNKNCSHCNMSNHTTDSCFKLHPELRRNKRQKRLEVNSIQPAELPSIPVKINNHATTALVDTASTNSLINKQLKDYLNLFIKDSSFECNSYSSHKIPIYGQTNVKLTLQGLSPSIFNNFDFLVSNNPNIPVLLGMDSISQFGLVIDTGTFILSVGDYSYYYKSIEPTVFTIDMAIESIVKLVKQYAILFEDRIGLTPKYQFRLHFKKTPPNFHKKPFRVPFSQMEAVKKEVDRLIKYNIIKLQSSGYTSSTFLVPKPMNLWRIVVDYSKTLNQYLERQYYPIPTIDDILYKIMKNMIYSKLDQKSGFYHIGMHPEDRKYTAFSLPWGTYVYLRMPMGISPAPESFQEFMYFILGHLDFILIYIDDILIMSSTMQQHYTHLQIVFEILKENDIVLNKDKCQSQR